MDRKSAIWSVACWVRLPALLLCSGAMAAHAGLAAQNAPDGEEKPAPQAADEQKPDALVRLSNDYDVWIDLKKKEVLVDGTICLREGQLEMFACPRETKEHESIVAINSKAMHVHAGLLAVGARPGKPVTFDPQYQPARGEVIDVFVQWKDQQGKLQRVRAQEWIRDIKTGKPMAQDWVFAGSGFFNDDQTGKQYYLADGGDFICVSNFPTATLDLPVKSSQDAGSLLFEAFTERIPPRGQKVRLILKPHPKKDGKPNAAPQGEKKPDGKPEEKKAAEKKPAKAAETKPKEKKPAEKKPAKAAETKPKEKKPAKDAPAESKPAENKSGE